MPSLSFPVIFSWLFVGAFSLVLFIGSHSFFRGFDSPYTLLADGFLFLAALLLGVGGLLLKGLAPFRYVSRSFLTPYFLIVLLVQISSGIANQAPTAIQAITSDLAYAICIIFAVFLWNKECRRPLFFLIGGSLVLVFTFVLYHWLRSMASSPLASLDFTEIFSRIQNATVQATQRYPFYNPNFMAAYVGPLVAGIWTTWSIRWLPLPTWWIFLTIPMVLFAWISKAMILILFCVLIVLALVTPDNRRRRLMRIFAGAYGLIWSIVALKNGGVPQFFQVGAGFVFLGIVVWVLYRLFLKQRFMIIAGLVFVVCISVGLLFSANFFSDSHTGKFPTIEKFVYDTSSGSRLLLWEGVWRGVVEGDPGVLSPADQQSKELPAFKNWVHRLLGYGPGFYVFKSSLFRESAYYSGAYTSDYTIHPHSSVFSFLADSGLSGGVVWSLLFGQFFLLLWRYQSLKGEGGRQAKVLLIVSLVLAAHSLVSAASAYPVHRLLWVLVFSGVISLELKHRRFVFEQEKKWPREFAGPFHAIIVGVILLFCFKGFSVISERWYLLRELKREMVHVVNWRKYEDRKSKKPPKRELSINRVETIMRRTEANLMAYPGRDWVNVNVIKTLKYLALARENYVAWAQAHEPKETSLGTRWRVQTFENLRQALEWTPGFTDLSRLYGEILWKVSMEARRSGMSSFTVHNQNYSILEAQAEAAAWLSYSLVKGTRDYYVFDTLLMRSTFEGLRTAVFDDLKKHPIQHPSFRRRLLSGAKIKESLRKSWIRWQLYFGAPGDFEDLMKVIQTYVLSERETKRYELIHLFMIDILRHGRPIPLEAVEMLSWGGASSPEKKYRNLSLNPPSYGWVIEVLRMCHFGNPLNALELLRKSAKENPSKRVYKDLANLIESFLLTSREPR